MIYTGADNWEEIVFLETIWTPWIHTTTPNCLHDFVLEELICSESSTTFVATWNLGIAERDSCRPNFSCWLRCNFLLLGLSRLLSATHFGHTNLPSVEPSTVCHRLYVRVRGDGFSSPDSAERIDKNACFMPWQEFRTSLVALTGRTWSC